MPSGASTGKFHNVPITFSPSIPRYTSFLFDFIILLNIFMILFYFCFYMYVRIHARAYFSSNC